MHGQRTPTTTTTAADAAAARQTWGSKGRYAHVICDEPVPGRQAMIVETDHQKIEWLHGGAMSILLEGDRPTGNSPWSVCAAAAPWRL
jgi:hypothetical protein